MKLCNIKVDGAVHLAIVTPRGVVDASAAGYAPDMDAVIAGADMAQLAAIAADESLPVVEKPDYANVINRVGKIVCVGMNYRDHAASIDLKSGEKPTLFSKYADTLVPCGAAVTLPPWEESYDYEAELVIVIGRRAWGVGEDEAMDYVFGYTCGNDFSCRAPQKRTSQWLCGKTMPGFGPCGPAIVTADSFDPAAGKRIKSYVNGEQRQNGSTADMTHPCVEIISYASHYMALEPGDLIFTGTPSGVALEKDKKLPWLKPGDRVDVEIEDIGVLTNYMV